MSEAIQYTRKSSYTHISLLAIGLSPTILAFIFQPNNFKENILAYPVPIVIFLVLLTGFFVFKFTATAAFLVSPINFFIFEFSGSIDGLAKGFVFLTTVVLVIIACFLGVIIDRRSRIGFFVSRRSILIILAILLIPGIIFVSIGKLWTNVTLVGNPVIGPAVNDPVWQELGVQESESVSKLDYFREELRGIFLPLMTRLEIVRLSQNYHDEYTVKFQGFLSYEWPLGIWLIQRNKLVEKIWF